MRCNVFEFHDPHMQLTEDTYFCFIFLLDMQNLVNLEPISYTVHVVGKFYVLKKTDNWRRLGE